MEEEVITLVKEIIQMYSNLGPKYCGDIDELFMPLLNRNRITCLKINSILSKDYWKLKIIIYKKMKKDK